MYPSPAVHSPFGAAASSSSASEQRMSDGSMARPSPSSSISTTNTSMPAPNMPARMSFTGEAAASSSPTSAAAVAQQAPPASYLRTSRISCDPCRRRKLRCDRVMPCSTCVRRGIQDRCYQEESSALPTSQQDTSSTQMPSSSSFTFAQNAAEGSNGPSPGNFAKRPRSNGAGFNDGDGRATSRDSGHDGPSPRTREEELEAMLGRYRQELLTLSTTARESSNALDMALRALHTQRTTVVPSPSAPPKGPGPPIQGTGPGGLYVWTDISAALPSTAICESLLTFYFEQLSIYIRINQRSAVEGMWERLHSGEGIGENAVRIICTMLAMASGTAPANAGVVRFSPKDHFRWVAIMGSPLVSRFGEPVDNSYERILAIALLSIYFLFTGSNDRLWECLGSAVRRGYAHGLFDERSRSWDDASPLEKEYRRRLAWYMISLERWQAFMRQLPFALHPDYIHLAEPLFEPDEVVARKEDYNPPITPTSPMTLSDGRLQTHVSARSRRVVKFVFIELVAVCHSYLREYSSIAPEQRYSRATQIDELLESKLVEGLSETGVEHHQDLHFLRYLTCATLDTVPKERHLEVNLWVSSIFFLRCIITRRFLTDDHAPQHLRFVGLTYAQGILSTIPMLTRLVKEGRIPLQMTWNANHLLCAATTFAVVILGHDPYQGIDDGAQGRAHSGTSSNSRINKNLFPQEQVQWLADNIFTTLECLGTLVARGNNTAMVAKRILERLCGSQNELQTLYRRRFNLVADGGDTCVTPTMLTKSVREGGGHSGAVRAEGASRPAHHAWQRSSQGPPSPSGNTLPPLHSSSQAYASNRVWQPQQRPGSAHTPPSVSQFAVSASAGSGSRSDARPLLPPLGSASTGGASMGASYGQTSSTASMSHGHASPSLSHMRGYQRPGYIATTADMHDVPDTGQHTQVYDGFSSMSSLHPTAMPASAMSSLSVVNNGTTAPRAINASSLLDAVLMDPVDLDFLGESNTSDLLAFLLQQETSVKTTSG